LKERDKSRTLNERRQQKNKWLDIEMRCAGCAAAKVESYS
jgi:hypothetical protein